MMLGEKKAPPCKGGQREEGLRKSHDRGVGQPAK